MEKLLLRMKIDLDVLEKVIKQFTEFFSPKKITNKLRFSHLMSENIDKKLIRDIILYTVSKQLNYFISEEQKNKESNLLKYIRCQYCKLSLSIWKKQMRFEVWMIYLTKLICCFYQESFVDISVTMKIQAQIYIILIHSLIGLSVNKKCYELLNSKYYIVKSLQKPKKLLFQTKSIKLSRMGTLNSYKKKGSNRDSHFQQENRLSVELMSPQYVELKSFIKQTIRINSLPKVKNSKKQIQTIFMEKQDEKQDEKSVANYQSEMKKKVIQSSQVSTSFQSQMLNHNIQLPSQINGFKIPHRIQFRSNHVTYRKNDKKKQLNKTSNFVEHNKNDLKAVQFQSWQRVLKKLKNSSCEPPQKLQLSSLFPQREKKECENKQNMDFNYENQRKTIHELPAYKQQKTQIQILNYNAPSNNKQVSPPMKLDYFTRDFKQIPVTKNPSSYSQKKGKNSQLRSQQLKRRRVQFQKMNQIRDQSIKYSIFLLPNQKQRLTNMQ